MANIKIWSNITFMIVLFFTIFYLTACDNKTKVIESKKEISQETKAIEEEKNKNENLIDSLDKEIKMLSKTKTELSKRMEFAEAEIYNIIKKSYLDHIIGTNNLEKSKAFFRDMLGFSIKEGKKHDNGILNFFIEFEDSSEIELMSIDNNKENLLSREYNRFLKNEEYGFQFAVRTNEIINLKSQFSTLTSDFTQFDENKFYSTLSRRDINQELPLFFIEHHQKNYNTKTNHLNKAEGISAVWLSTKDIRKSVKQFVDFGFSIVDTINIGNFRNKTVLLKNDNFEIILIDGGEYKISGLTLRVSNIDNIKNFIKKNTNNRFQEQHNKRGRSILLNPSITNSIWFEFLQETN